MENEGSVLGIDVGWSIKYKKSAVCRLYWTAREIDWKIGRFIATADDREKTISKIAGDHLLLAVAIDGPLRHGFDQIGHYRSAERLLSRGELPKRIGKPGQSSSPNGKNLNIQANKSAEFVKQRCRIREAHHPVKIDKYAIVEAFPTTFLGTMIENLALLDDSNKKRSDRYFIHLAKNQCFEKLVRRLIGNRTWSQPLFEVVNHDDRAALVCAFTALCVATGEFTAVGDKEDGWIILPPRWMYAGWAWTALGRASPNESGKLLSFPYSLTRPMP